MPDTCQARQFLPPCAPGAYSLETDGKHPAQGDSAGIADRWDLGFSQLGSTNRRGLGSFLWTWATGRLMVSLIEIPKLGGVVVEGLEYERFGFWMLILR